MITIKENELNEINRVLNDTELRLARITGLPCQVEAKINDSSYRAAPIAKVRLTMEKLREIICQYYRLSVSDFCSKLRTRERVLPRQMFCYIGIRRNIGTLKEMGIYIGGRDHSTVIHSRDVIQNDILYNRGIQEDHKLINIRILNLESVYLPTQTVPQQIINSPEYYLSQVKELCG